MAFNDFKSALDLHKKWFLESGIMPDSGKQGIAERVLIIVNNSAAEKAMTTFPSWTKFENGCILEQRRADCCFETAYYFLYRFQLFNDPEDREICKNILNYLYCRSGLLRRYPNITACDEGVWNWSNIGPSVWFDDNAWCIMLALAIADTESDFDKKYDMKKYALAGAAALADGFERQWKNQNGPVEGKLFWSGNLELPHWGALAVCALQVASAAETDKTLVKRYHAIDRIYYDFIKENQNDLNFSELSYALLYCGMSLKYNLSEEKKELGNAIRKNLLANCDPKDLCLPSTHYEAPKGNSLADLIYTMNWFYTAMTVFEKELPSPAGQKWLKDFSAFLIAIQDKSDQRELHGCWRGMYDITKNSWGGGDCHEGGANSIYSGWTNAPIGWSLAACSLIK